MKKFTGMFLLIFFCLFVLCINTFADEEDDKKIDQKARMENIRNYIDKDGDTIESRFNLPDDCYRDEVAINSFANYVRSYKLDKFNTKVRLYNRKYRKKPKYYHLSVTRLPMVKDDLQQCADSIMRIYSDYLYKIGAKDKISFHFVKGFKLDYKKWKSGYSVFFRDELCTKPYWGKSRNKDNKESYIRFLRNVFAYSSTLSMAYETKKIKPDNIKIGDVFLNPGSPGHVCMVVDVAVNDNGDKYFILGEGSTPAQNFVIIDNPKNPGNPWYHIKKGQKTLNTISAKFDIKKALRHPTYLDDLKIKLIFEEKQKGDNEEYDIDDENTNSDIKKDENGKDVINKEDIHNKDNVNDGTSDNENKDTTNYMDENIESSEISNIDNEIDYNN